MSAIRTIMSIATQTPFFLKAKTLKMKKAGCIRRIVFNSEPDREQNKRDLEREWLKIQLANAIQYGFDFVAEKKIVKN